MKTSTIKRKIGGLLYYLFASKLPPSYSGLQIGQVQLRRMCGKLMMEHCGKNVNIEKHAFFSKNVSLGDFSGLGVNSKIYGTCKIGNYVMMGEDCTIITRNHKHDNLNIPMMELGFDEELAVEIGDDVWIGDKVIILPGVKIGRGSIIGAGAVVTKNVPEYSVAVGNPARVIRQRYRV